MFIADPNEWWAFDTETWRITDAEPVPRLVLGSIYCTGQAALLDRRQCIAWFRLAVRQHKLTTLNGPFDFLVMRRAILEDTGEDILREILNAYRERRLYDVGIAEQLNALAMGHLGINPKTRAPTRYSLDDCTSMILGRDNAKVNDEWRTDYALLDGLPIECLPDKARTYPIDDVRNTWDCTVAQRDRNKNQHDINNQQFTDFCLRIGAVHGLTVDPDAIDKVEQLTVADRVSRQGQLIEMGFLQPNGKKNTAYVKRRICEAFGVSGQCPTCAGSGKVPSRTKAGEIKYKRHKDCGGAGCDGCLDGQVYTGFKGCATCSSTGLDLTSAPYPLTASGGVSAGRDALHESGDEQLLDLADYDETAKVMSTYVPWLKKGLTGPIVLKPRVLKETGRAGYGDVVHQLPRGMTTATGETIDIRGCIVARPGYALLSTDWTGAELITHAQSCLSILGWSDMADALNAGVAVHDQLGARIGGMTYEYMLANKKTDKRASDCRQSAKPANFGFPGLMGAPTMVLQQRKQGPDTYGTSGRRYKGLRFCILASGADECGLKGTVTEWNGKQYSPMCRACVETCEDIRKTWLATWTENPHYFDYIKRVHATGSMVQHYTKRVRSGMSLCAAANGLFQGLAGDAMKLAIQWMTWEMYADPKSPLYRNAVLILPIHDEALCEVRLDVLHECAERISYLMVEALATCCPQMRAACEAPPAAMLRWDKSAEPVYDANGRLQPWETIPK